MHYGHDKQIVYIPISLIILQTYSVAQKEVLLIKERKGKCCSGVYLLGLIINKLFSQILINMCLSASHTYSLLIKIIVYNLSKTEDSFI